MRQRASVSAAMYSSRIFRSFFHDRCGIVRHPFAHEALMHPDLVVANLRGRDCLRADLASLAEFCRKK